MPLLFSQGPLLSWLFLTAKWQQSAMIWTTRPKLIAFETWVTFQAVPKAAQRLLIETVQSSPGKASTPTKKQASRSKHSLHFPLCSTQKQFSLIILYPLADSFKLPGIHPNFILR
jgi:hypothetical protein